MVQGIFGIGPETSGPIVIANPDPARRLTVADIRPEHKGAVLVGGSLADLAVLRRAIEVGVAALVTGGLDAADLKTLLGYDLGVAITGGETVGSRSWSEGFGSWPCPRARAAARWRRGAGRLGQRRDADPRGCCGRVLVPGARSSAGCDAGLLSPAARCASSAIRTSARSAVVSPPEPAGWTPGHVASSPSPRDGRLTLPRAHRGWWTNARIDWPARRGG
jgi:hypothetical protein